MEFLLAFIGLVAGGILSFLITRHYYVRTFDKKLSIFRLLNAAVFAGIAPDVRRELHFRFKDRDVEELQHLMFLVANTGERAVHALIEPLRLPLPPTAVILDASIVHRSPENLNAALRIEHGPSGGSEIHLDFPLLNTREFFVIKLLLSGKPAASSFQFHIACEDLPRTLQVETLPPDVFREVSSRFELGLAVLAGIVFAIPAWISYALYTLQQTRPSLFPYPWATYQFSVESVALLLPASLIAIVLSGIAVAALAAAFFGGEFPPRKRAGFALPKHVRDAVYPYRTWAFHPEFGQTPPAPEDNTGKGDSVG